MSSGNNANNNETPPKFRTIDLSAEIRNIYGDKWTQPEISYEFGKRKFTLRTGDAAIYATSPDF